MRYIVSIGLSALIISAAAVRAEEAPKLKVPEVKIDAKAQKNAETKMEAVKKDADSKVNQAKDKAAEAQKQQAKKADELKKEAAKGSEQGQAMKKEHSKKWWKFGTDKEPAPAK